MSGLVGDSRVAHPLVGLRRHAGPERVQRAGGLVDALDRDAGVDVATAEGGGCPRQRPLVPEVGAFGADRPAREREDTTVLCGVTRRILGGETGSLGEAADRNPCSGRPASK